LIFAASLPLSDLPKFKPKRLAINLQKNKMIAKKGFVRDWATLGVGLNVGSGSVCRTGASAGACVVGVTGAGVGASIGAGVTGAVAGAGVEGAAEGGAVETKLVKRQGSM